MKPAFIQLAASFGIKFMETSAKANINIENVSTGTFLLHLLSSLCKGVVRTLAHPGWVQNSAFRYFRWVFKDIPEFSMKMLSHPRFAKSFRLVRQAPCNTTFVCHRHFLLLREISKRKWTRSW